MIPRKLADVLDAVSAARRMARNELAVQVLQAWADERIHESIIVQRVVGPQSGADGGVSAFASVKRTDR